ncbi:MAG: hypothetical protein ACREU3_09210 [Steroidobacteraceae bacterium]
MIDRRRLIASGTAASFIAALVGAPLARARAAVLGPVPAGPPAGPPAMPAGWDEYLSSDRIASLRLVLFDERFAAACRFGKAMRRNGLPVRAIRGDVTDVWYSRLHPLWKREPAAVAGLTAYAAMFCLERLARDHGLRMTRFGARTAHVGALAVHEQSGAVELHSWIILPKGSEA